MFSITVALANTQIVWTFMYKTKESAEKWWGGDHGNISSSMWLLEDDFGQKASIPRTHIAGALFEDLDQSKMAHIERSLHVERVKVAANRAAQADPMLKTAMMARNGNGVGMFDPTR